MRRLTILPLIASVACSEQTAGGDGFDAARMVATEELRIGSPDDEETAFTWFRELEIGPDGTIYTGHPQQGEVRMHSESGEFIRTVGRYGEGPGEFDRVGRMAIVGDTLWVLDYGQYRLSYFDLAGNYLGSERIPINVGDSPTEEPLRPSGRLPDGTIVGSRGAAAQRVASGELTDSYIATMDAEGNARDTIGWVSLVHSVWEIADRSEKRSFGTYRRQPFGDSERLSISKYDATAVRVNFDPAPEDAAPRITVTSWHIGGDTVFDRAYAYEPVPLRTEMVDSIVDSFAQSDFLRGRITPANAERWAREGLYLPEYHPPVSALVIGQDGRLWLRAEELGEPVVTWRIISDEGSPIGTVDLPTGFTMMFARGLQVWGMELGEFDVPQIVRYGVADPAGT